MQRIYQLSTGETTVVKNDSFVRKAIIKILLKTWRHQDKLKLY